ncbi:hypothetical protein ACK3OH_004539 [Salmonella enterica]
MPNRFSDDAFQDLENERRQASYDEFEAQRVSQLPPSGFTMTNTELHSAAKRIVERAREYFKCSPAPLDAHVWPYRYDDCLMLSCDLHCKSDVTKIMPITITASKQLELSRLDEPQVYDMAEALHLVGIVTRSLNAKIVLGCGENETNPDVLHEPLKDKQTNGSIELWSIE